MAFDGFTLKAVVQELSCLTSGKISKIYEPTSDEIILGVYSNGINYALNLNISSSFYSIHLTTNSKPNPLSAPNFCMLLRKYIIGFKIKNIAMNGLERICTIELEGYNELNDLVTLKLIVELMGKHSNIILVNNENTIIDSLKHLNTFSGSYRNILPGATYELPKSDKLDINNVTEELYNNLSDEDRNCTLSSYFMNHFTGTSNTLIEYSIAQLKISEEFIYENFKILLTYLKNLIEKIKLNKVDVITIDNDYTLYSSKETNMDNLKINFFLDDYYYQKEQNEQFTQYRNNILNFILKNLKKISKKLDGVNSKIKECSNMEKYQLYGELLTTYLYKIDNKHVESITLENYYDGNKPIDIPLDITLSPSDNAKKYFKKYHKLKNTIDIVTKQKDDLEKEINYLESIVYELQISKNIQDIDNIYQEMEEANLFSRKTLAGKASKNYISDKISSGSNKKTNSSHSPISKEKSKSDFLSCKIDNFLVLIGRNNKENDYLTLKIAKENDIWFHVKDIQGSHVILVVENKEPSLEIINKVAAITAYYSKAKQSSNVPVDYTLAKYVKKPSKAKPGMVIYTNQKTVNVQPKTI